MRPSNSKAVTNSLKYLSEGSKDAPSGSGMAFGWSKSVPERNGNKMEESNPARAISAVWACNCHDLEVGGWGNVTRESDLNHSIPKKNNPPPVLRCFWKDPVKGPVKDDYVIDLKIVLLAINMNITNDSRQIASSLDSQ